MLFKIGFAVGRSCFGKVQFCRISGSVGSRGWLSFHWLSLRRFFFIYRFYFELCLLLYTTYFHFGWFLFRAARFPREFVLFGLILVPKYWTSGAAAVCLV
jgi:hypothetical protein